MRIVNKNEMLTLLDDRMDAFAQFYLSDPVMKFKWDSASSFDLDLPVMQSMVVGLYAAGIFDEACKLRFDAFGVVPVPEMVVEHIYKVPVDFTRPENSTLWIDGNEPAYYWVAVPYEIVDSQAQEVLANGIY